MQTLMVEEEPLCWDDDERAEMFLQDVKESFNVYLEPSEFAEAANLGRLV